jgi:protein TonB
VLPVYPRFARRIGKEGTVMLRLTLDEGGSLKNVELLEKAGHGFDEAAVAAVRASRFRPALRHGRPVSCRAILPVRFELQD